MLVELLAALQATSVPQEQAESWTAAEVDAYIVANQPKSNSADDPFTLPAAAPPPAARVAFSVPVARMGTVGAESPIEATWSYDAATQTLKLVARPEYVASMSLTTGSRDYSLNAPVAHQGWATFSKTDSSDGGAASNAYGATVQVRDLRVEYRGLGQLGRYSDEVGPSTGERYRTSYEYSYAVGPEEARALVQRIRFEVNADTVAWSPGKWVVCGVGGTSPTIRSPIRSLYTGCFLTVQVQSVRFVDSADGTIIREWSVARRR